jgi:hypothetical protein
MRIIRLAVAVLTTLALVVTAPGAEKVKKGNKAAAHVHGVVIAVDKDAKTITVKVHEGKKGDPNATTVEKKFTVTDTTMFETVCGKKGAKEVKAATFADVAKDQHVVLKTVGDAAVKVKIVLTKLKAEAPRYGRSYGG